MSANTYGATGGELSKPAQAMMGNLGGEVLIKRRLNPIELMGLEGKNSYDIYNGTKVVKDTEGFTREESGCFERNFFCEGRELTFVTHQNNKQGPTALKLKKERHYPCCFICSRPSAALTDGEGHLIGRVEDPCACYAIHHDLLDAQGQPVLTVDASTCQLGFCCPCLSDFNFSISRGAKQVGTMKRLALSMTEMCCPMSRFTVKFPADATPQEKALVMSSQLMLDVVYFDIKNDRNAD